MKQLFIFSVFLIPILFVSCDSDINDFNPDKDPLKGKLAGKSWTYGSGNASYSIFSNDIEGLLLIDDLEDPCGTVVTTKAHVSVKFPPQRGNYNLPYINSSGSNTADVVFHLQGGSRYTATSGFLEVVQITSTEIVGFISADYDENNFVEGAFLLRVCN